jgi:hypothetical protein
MNERTRLQLQYANALYHAAVFTREAEIAKSLLDAMANEEAEARFGKTPASAQLPCGEDK